MQRAAIAIRAVTVDAYPVWLPLWHGYQVFYEVELPVPVTASTWQRLLDPTEPVHGALAWAGGQAVGLVHWVTHRTTWSEADDCYLQDLFVQSTARGGGVGRWLIEHVVKAAAQAGCASVYWITHENNATAQRLYDRIASRSGFIHYCQPL
jgi:GNAT superfamily N-acetyltransferase